jgi:L,D-transpeptidase ErfK/SrfK
VVPPGPDNPLGEHALRLGIPKYLIHGTNKPFGIGMRVSHGCIRMYPQDIAALFPDVPIGAKVEIVNQPYLMGWSDGRLELEVHLPLEEDTERYDPQYLNGLVAQRSAAGGDPIDPFRVSTLAAEARGIPVPINIGAPSLAAIIRDAPVVRHEPPDSLQVAGPD